MQLWQLPPTQLLVPQLWQAAPFTPQNSLVVPGRQVLSSQQPAQVLESQVCIPVQAPAWHCPPPAVQSRQGPPAWPQAAASVPPRQAAS